MNKFRKIGATTVIAIGVAVAGATSAAAYASSVWYTSTDFNTLDGCKLDHDLGTNFVEGMEMANCARDVGVQAKYSVGTSYYTGAVHWDSWAAIIDYGTGYHTYAIKDYHGTH